MIDNFTYAILPIYTSTDYQNFRKKWMYDDLCTAPLISASNRFIPFQIKRKTKSNVLISVDLIDYEGNIIDDWLPYIPTADIDITTAGTIDFISYFGNRDLTNELPCGCYYLDIYDGSTHYYTEVFKVVDCSWFKQGRIVAGNVSLNPKSVIAIQTQQNQILTHNTNIT